MHTNIRWTVALLACALFWGIGTTPVLAQSSAESSIDTKKQKLEQLKKEYAAFQKAGKADEYQTAYRSLSEAVRLAEATDQSNALAKLRNFQQKLPTKWGNKALKAEQYDRALTHFEKGIEWSPDDAYVYYGKGLALVNMDSTAKAMAALQDAIRVGNENGDMRTATLATERIRQEYIAKASKALSAQNPTTAKVNEALAHLDEMKTYVDPSAKSLFYRATALYEKGAYDQAIATAEQGLDRLQQGSRTDRAKYHFIVAESQMKLGNEQSACQTFEKAAFGDYKARSDHYLKNECE
jgi:tetratricopeptide (TPR) repeat protein